MVCLVLLGLTGGMAYFSGEPAEDAVEGIATVSHNFIEEHEDAAWFSFLGAIACGIIGVVGLVGRTEPSRKWTMSMGLAAVSITFGLMSWTANLGGMVRHTEIRPIGEVRGSAAPDHVDDND